MKQITGFTCTLILIFTGINTASAAPTVYIPLGSGNQVIAVDAATDTITASYPGVDNPHGLVATEDGEYLIAGSLNEAKPKTNEPANTPNSKLFFIHPAHGHVMSTIPVSGWTHHQAITPDSRYVISTHGSRGYISIVDLQKNKVIKTINTGPAPNYTIISKNGKYAYVSNSGNNSISEIDLKDWKIIRTLEAGPAPEHMVFSSDEKLIYVTNPRAGQISVVSIKSGKITNRHDIGKRLHGLDIGDDGKTLFISSIKNEKLVALDTQTNSKREIKLSPSPYHLNTIRGTGKIYVSSRKKPIIWVIDQKQLKVLRKIKLPAGEAHQMAIVDE